MFGKHLVDKGLLSEQQLVDALEQQQQMRPSVGRLAFELEMLDLDQVVEIIDAQKGRELRFCALGVELGHLTPEQRQEILAEQLQASIPLGQVLAAMGLLTVEVLTEELDAYHAKRDAS